MYVAPFTDPLIELVTGPPKSGKSEEAMHRYRLFMRSPRSKDYKMLVVKHLLEDKDSNDSIISINRLHKLECMVSDNPYDIASAITENTSHVAICGINFFEDSKIVDLFSEIRDSGRNVFGTGINRTYDDKPYNYVGRLLSIADFHEQKLAYCSECGENANRSESHNGAEPKCLLHYHKKLRPDHRYFLTEQTGTFHVVSGHMFSGKTRKLAQLVKQASLSNVNYLLFKYSKDERYSISKIISHDKEDLGDAIKVTAADEIVHYLSSDNKTTHIFIDEIQFLKGIHDVVQHLLYQGYHVTGTLLPKDFRGLPFGESPELLTLADNIRIEHGSCVNCEHPATDSHRFFLDNGVKKDSPWLDDVEKVGGEECYEAVCRKCLNIPGKPKPVFNIVPKQDF